MDQDDIFSPFRSPSARQQAKRPLQNSMDDDDGLFLSSPSRSEQKVSPAFTYSPALRTPVKHSFNTPDRTALRATHLNAPHATSPLRFSPVQGPTINLGTKRKPTQLSTPIAQRTVTPLKTIDAENPPSPSFSFDRLAPLPAPRFTATHTPQTKGETEFVLRKQAEETLGRLRICDLDESSDDELKMSALDDDGAKLFFTSNTNAMLTQSQRGKGKQDEEVAEAVSPGGHVTKRRARSRPVSAELMESVKSPRLQKTPAPVNPPPAKVAFPTRSRTRTHNRNKSTSSTSSSSSSDPCSPIPRNRIPTISTTSGTSGPIQRTRTDAIQPPAGRQPFNRQTSASSATLFFGPEIVLPSTQLKTNEQRKLNVGSTVANRHSYAGPGSVSKSPSPWFTSRSPLKALGSSPSPPMADMDDLFFDFDGNHDNSFSFSVDGGTPSPRCKFTTQQKPSLPKKYKPRDSGVVLSDSEDDGAGFFGDSIGGSNNRRGGYLSVNSMPSASTSVSTIHSSGDEGMGALITPGFGPGMDSGWPSVGVVSLDDDVHHSHSVSHPPFGAGMSADPDMDAFILRTLASSTGGGVKADGRGMGGGPGEWGAAKKAPGTPVKRMKTTHLIGGKERPWASAVASKVGVGFDDFGKIGDGVTGKGKGVGKGRKSLPAVFPSLNVGKKKGGGKYIDEAESSEDDAETSPSFARRDGRYDGLGLGRPSVGGGPAEVFKKPWLMRRSSSGAFSSGSETSGSLGTPTRLKDGDSRIPQPQIRSQFSATTNSLQVSSATGSSRTSATIAHSPLGARNVPRNLPIPGNPKNPPPPTNNQTRIRTRSHLGQRGPVASPFKLPHHPHHSQPSTQHVKVFLRSEEDQPGKFERDFMAVDEIGSGAFGKVFKVKYARGMGRAGEVFAVKKSKRFEGVKHRQRLREEVDILKHLSREAPNGCHPNILAYVDSWEEDEALYIQTELCDLGNFAHFLWEYGRAFPKLDEARVWKIFADLSNGLRFIHDHNVIHLDLKPANIFVTADGRFRIGDFGMASIWPRPDRGRLGGFEREGDKLYLAPEVLQGNYGKAADIFSLGMTMLETASNIVVPDQGESWHRLRREDFAQVDLEDSPELFDLLKDMMRTDPILRVDVHAVWAHPVVSRARTLMDRMFVDAQLTGSPLFTSSPLASVPAGFLEDILGRRGQLDDVEMDLGP
ncbi:hypothetical protein JAAARDRAFT_47622 [Jaapia argillacea MUCL 33604]|uniref:Protein kinase domain-containing protein n=1 Tax=Jaapia argillacea MUCL 33604 TaxID=933084 RepID=A0A067Q5B8_9AGAM|nr:hypothetical protein JAAARDRAFT_47622 [Jaapia argillacea MUCL 33604]